MLESVGDALDSAFHSRGMPMLIAVPVLFLAGLKYGDYRRTRIRISAEYTPSSPHQQNCRVEIRNHSGQPLRLHDWEIVQITGRWPDRTENSLLSAIAPDNLEIPPGASHTLIFKPVLRLSTETGDISHSRIRIHCNGHKTVICPLVLARA